MSKQAIICDSIDQALAQRINALDWEQCEKTLAATGHFVVGGLLDMQQCRALSNLYQQDEYFRKTVVMARHNFGRGEYRYFTYPLPPLIQTIRATVYPYLARIANRWQDMLGIEERYPDTFPAFVADCHARGQREATPLLLSYGPEDYNCLHQDLYGDIIFPLQVAIQLSQPTEDFTGGEFVLTEQRPRMQSRAEVVPLGQGDAVIFPVKERPCKGARGYYRVNMRHGVSRVRSGARMVAGIIFHDAT